MLNISPSTKSVVSAVVRNGDEKEEEDEVSVDSSEEDFDLDDENVEKR